MNYTLNFRVFQDNKAISFDKGGCGVHNISKKVMNHTLRTEVMYGGFV